jgi:hypothetical protein
MKLEVCKPEKTYEEQLDHCGQEFEELVQALAIYRNKPTQKNRAEVLLEALDCITCLWTFIFMIFSRAEIDAGINVVNCKNYVRGYLLTPEDFDVESVTDKTEELLEEVNAK